MPDLYPPIPNDVVDGRKLITRPWTLFFQGIIDRIQDLLDRGTYQSWTPVLSATGTAPSPYTSSGRYSVSNGRVRGSGTFVLGAAFAPGTGVYTIVLPVATVTPSNSVEVIGSALVRDANTGLYYSGVIKRTSATVATLVFGSGVAQMGPLVPITFTTSDQIGVSFGYEAG